MTRRLLLLASVGAAVAAAFAPAATFHFLNWDDNVAIVNNAALAFPGAATWAFTTSLLEHYQPISWLTWAAIKARAGVDAQIFHAANIVAHVVCVLLVWAVARGILVRALRNQSPHAVDAGASAAALLYGLHPLRVEVVAWISALPYALATALALAATLAWIRASSQKQRFGALLVPILLYGASLAARPLALGLPIVLVVLDVWLFKRTVAEGSRRAAPFALFAAIAAAGEVAARAPSTNPTPWQYWLQSAAAAPFIYLWHTAAPIALTPLDVLPVQPQGSATVAAVAIGALLVVSALAWRYRDRSPAVAAAWVSYLALLAPAVGVMPSGLQATADRYTYLPAIVIATAVAGAAIRWTAMKPRREVIAGAALVAVSVACGVASRAALQPWRDSISLWTRVVALDATNDVGLYNLALALSADGRSDEAAARYRDLLALVPAHADARANLDRLEALRLEREGNDLAGRGDLSAAAERYAQALARDPRRTHSRAARGVALATLGRPGEAIPELQAAARQGENDPAVANTLAVLLLQTGKLVEARSVLETAAAQHPRDVGIAHNLARLLVSGPAAAKADAERALQLANSVVDATGGQDPRALETLATALAANGRLADADAANIRAAAVAEAAGDHELAVQITARRRAYRNAGQ